jgi:hypothetical protein
MVGITAYGAYIPYNRLNRQHIQNAFGGSVPKGEKAVANYDEDSLTMGAAAALECSRTGPKSVLTGFILPPHSPTWERKAAATTIVVFWTCAGKYAAPFLPIHSGRVTALLAGLVYGRPGRTGFGGSQRLPSGGGGGPYENTFGMVRRRFWWA